MMKNKTIKTVLLICALSLPFSARAGYPVFDVSKTAGLIVNLVQRFSVAKKHVERVKEVTEQINRIKARAKAMISGALLQVSGKAGKLLQGQSFTKDFGRFEYEQAAKEGRSATEVSDIISKEFFFESDNPSASEKSEKQSKRKNLVKKTKMAIKTKSIYYAYGGLQKARERGKKIEEMLNQAQSVQDSVIAEAYATMNLNFEKLDQISLNITEFENQMSDRISGAPFANYAKPRPPSSVGALGGRIEVKDEIDVDLGGEPDKK